MGTWFESDDDDDNNNIRFNRRVAQASLIYTVGSEASIDKASI